MSVLVTGAKGMLGQDLCPILEDAGYEVIETDVDTLDITNAEQVNQVLKDKMPEVVIHCAAYTNVDKAEEDLKTAELINVTGTENIADACGKLGITMVYISTDYVFDGTKDSPYTPQDKPNPINNYGMTKYKGEEAVRSFCEKHYIARTSWLYGHHGKNFVETMLSLKDKEELKVVDDQIGCPTWTVELANGILKLLDSKPYGTYHVCGSGHTTWYGFAKEIFKQAIELVHAEYINTKVNAITSKELARAPRPLNSRLDKSKLIENGFKLLPTWQDALNRYLHEIEF